MNIIGQSKLLEKLNNYTNKTLPKTLMFLGESGCGKHYIAKYLADKFNLELTQIDENISNEQLIEYSQKATPTLYIIDLVKFTDKQQNQFLKFIEEPAQSVYVLLLADSEIGILPTILNRCIKYHFEPYSVADLKKIMNKPDNDSELIYKICKTPGQLKSESFESIQRLYNLCNTLVDKINVASWANTLKISTEINYKEEYNKFDFNLFLNTLEYVSFEKYKNTKDNTSLIIYNIVNEAKKSLVNKVVIKENFMLNLLTRLWKETR